MCRQYFFFLFLFSFVMQAQASACGGKWIRFSSHVKKADVVVLARVLEQSNSGAQVLVTEVVKGELTEAELLIPEFTGPISFYPSEMIIGQQYVLPLFRNANGVLGLATCGSAIAEYHYGSLYTFVRGSGRVPRKWQRLEHWDKYDFLVKKYGND
jgi:hypothetical protein